MAEVRIQPKVSEANYLVEEAIKTIPDLDFWDDHPSTGAYQRILKECSIYHWKIGEIQNTDIPFDTVDAIGILIIGKEESIEAYGDSKEEINSKLKTALTIALKKFWQVPETKATGVALIIYSKSSPDNTSLEVSVAAKTSPIKE